MKKKILQCVIALCLGTGAMSSSAATSVPDYQDWWWNAAQSGMGVNIGQQDDTLVVAWYHFAPNGTGTYLMLSGKVQNNRLDGTLIRTEGPVPGEGYNPGAVKRTAAGTASIVFSSMNNAVLTYQFGNQTGSIPLERYTFETLGQVREAIMTGTVSLDQTLSCEASTNTFMHFPLWNYSSSLTPSDVLKIQVKKKSAGIYSLKLNMGEYAACSETGDLKQTGGILSGTVALDCEYMGVVITGGPYLYDGTGTLEVKNLRIDGNNTQLDFVMRPKSYFSPNVSLCPRVGSFRGVEIIAPDN